MFVAAQTRLIDSFSLRVAYPTAVTSKIAVTELASRLGFTQTARFTDSFKRVFL